MIRSLAFSLLLPLALPAAAGEILHYADLNTAEIRALDAANTVVILTGGILEEHGPYLPTGTDTHMSQHMAQTLARAITDRTDRDVLMLPVIYLGADGANVIGGHHPYPGTLTVRPETLRQVFMDYGDALGEAGFRTVLVAHIHGAPRHNLALDQAGDYFLDTWGGVMVNLYGLLPVQQGWEAAGEAMSEEARTAQGYSVHASAAEHAAVLYLAPGLVDPAYRDAPPQRAEDREAMVALARAKDWPGYFGAPAYATPQIGKAAMDAVEKSAIAIALQILAGADPAKFPRFSALPGLVEGEAQHAQRQRERQEAWLERRAGK